MSLILVHSSVIRAVGYEGSTLFVLFHRSSTLYRHPGVPHSVFRALLDAESKGGFYNQQIRGKYR